MERKVTPDLAHMLYQFLETLMPNDKETSPFSRRRTSSVVEKQCFFGL